MQWQWQQRNSVAPWWLGVLGLSALLAASIGLLFTVNLIPQLAAVPLASAFVQASSAALAGLMPALAIVVLAGRRLRSLRWRRWSMLSGAVAVAAFVGVILETGMTLVFDGELAAMRAPFWIAWFTNHGMRYLALTGLVATLQEIQRHSSAARAGLHAEQLRSVALQAQLAEARLQMLHAQLEPHFLFNSLANVRRLTQLDRGAGAALLADLLLYFEATLPRLRADDSTLATEVELARAFLAVHKVRMGERLAVEFDIPTALAATPLPTMMLLTLIENALKHGLGPLPEGGRIRIAAAIESHAIRLSVTDTGRGLVPGHGKGVGLANLRARLKSTYGAAAQLTLRLNEPRGVIASIVLPWRPT